VRTVTETTAVTTMAVISTAVTTTGTGHGCPG
jgi:hypothetical protein